MDVTTLSKHYAEIIDLNHRAVHLMEQGNFYAASLYFSLALKNVYWIRSILEEVPSILPPQLLVPRQSELHPLKMILGCRHQSEATSQILHSVTLPDRKDSLLHDEVVSLYNRALCVSLSTTKDTILTADVFQYILPSTILYNMGLIHHLRGLKDGKPQELTTAFELYSVAYITLAHYLESTRNTSILLVLGSLALTNNIAHIHAQFRRFTEVHICCDELSLCLQMLLTVSQLEEEYQPFLLNVCFQKQIHRLSAPAA
jgi:hypothetical protein